MNKIFVVIYIEDNSIEGFLERKEDFKKWLKKHNAERKAEGNDGEFADEFEIKEVFNLNSRYFS